MEKALCEFIKEEEENGRSDLSSGSEALQELNTIVQIRKSKNPHITEYTGKARLYCTYCRRGKGHAMC